MHRYTSYGLSIRSELPLPELVAAGNGSTGSESVDLTIRFVTDHALGFPPSGVTGTTWGTHDELNVYYSDAGIFRVSHGREILIERTPGATDPAIRFYLLSSIIAALLHQRGFLVLHASAVKIGSGAVAFVAEKGTGKSTFAAALQARGHVLVADDLVPVDLDAPEGPMVHPGYPQIRLYPESAPQLGDTSRFTSFELLPSAAKRGWRVENSFADRRLPLQCIYVLTNDDACEAIDELKPGQAFSELVRHSYLLTVLNLTGTQESHFRQVVRLVGMVPVRRLKRRRLMNLLPDVVRMVEDDLAVK